ncbi:hypothetical protein FACS1894166_06250 [Bacilli bacterium]|nr:hypothetical protein FACS1894166_06250 [Bacilli bacterium]
MKKYGLIKVLLPTTIVMGGVMVATIGLASCNDPAKKTFLSECTTGYNFKEKTLTFDKSKNPSLSSEEEGYQVGFDGPNDADGDPQFMGLITNMPDPLGEMTLSGTMFYYAY